MVHTDCRASPGVSETAGDGGADEQRSHQTGTRRVRHPVKLGPVCRCFVQDVSYQGQRLANVVAGGKLGHNPTVLGVQLDLTMQRVRQQTMLTVVDRDAGFVTRSLNA
jgi:hypothetical protein